MTSLAALALLVACHASPADSSVGTPTWAQDVAPILAGHCAGCHTAGGIAPFPLDDYKTAAALATDIATQVDIGRMPPWSAVATDVCTPPFPFVGDPRLTEDEKAILDAWAGAGAPEGDESAAADLPTPPSYELSSVTHTGTAATFAPSGTADEFECFVMDPQITKDSYLTGIQVVPGNPAVVHHALVFAIPRVGSHAVGSVYPCFGGVDENNATLIGAWIPGAMPLETPDGVGLPMKKGTQLVMQIHYHVLGATDLSPDQTSVSLRLTTKKPAHPGRLDLIGNFDGTERTTTQGLRSDPDDTNPSKPEFLIPAGKSAHTETMFYDLPDGSAPVRIWSVATHMHYVGVSETLQVVHKKKVAGESKTECLLATPKWDFSWQRVYREDVPIDQSVEVRPGDELLITCTYDNTLDNPAVVDSLAQQGLTEPQDVRLGETTLDEMCLGAFGSAAE
jgi:mono/diheme cytochrome c family protein